MYRKALSQRKVALLVQTKQVEASIIVDSIWGEPSEVSGRWPGEELELEPCSLTTEMLLFWALHLASKQHNQWSVQTWFETHLVGNHWAFDFLCC